jgi:hypothetical protein
VHCNVLCLGPEPRPLDRQGSTKILAQPEPSEEDLAQSLARWRQSTKLWRNLTPGWQKSLKAPLRCRRDRSGSRSRGSVRVGRHCGGRSKGPGGEPPDPGDERLCSAAPGHDRGSTASGGGPQLTRLATCLVLPEGGRRIRDLCPLSLRRENAVRGLRPNPGFGRPGRTGVAGATRRPRRLVCIKHCSNLLPDQRGQTRRWLFRHTRRLESPACSTPRKASNGPSDECPQPEGCKRSRRASCEARRRDLKTARRCRSAASCVPSCLWQDGPTVSLRFLDTGAGREQAPVTRLPKQPVPRRLCPPCGLHSLRRAFLRSRRTLGTAHEEPSRPTD